LDVENVIKRNVTDYERFKLLLLHHTIKKLFILGIKEAPFFTYHNELHSVNLINLLEEMRSANSNIKNKLKDKFYILYFSFYVHDTGMLFENKITRNELVKEFPYSIKKSMHRVLIFIKDLDIYNKIISEHEKIIQSKNRKNHSRASYDNISMFKNIENDEEKLKLISEISLYHGIDWKKEIDPEKDLLIRTLRLVDHLDITNERVTEILYKNVLMKRSDFANGSEIH